MSMTLIGTGTVGAGGAVGIDFNSIPQTYTDLLIHFSGRSAFAAISQQWYITINSTTYTINARNLVGTGASVSSNSTSEISSSLPAANSTSNTFGNATLYFPNYTSSVNKSVSIDSVGENNATTAGQAITAMLIEVTAPITAIQVQAVGQTLVQYSTASLYGILKGSGGASVS